MCGSASKEVATYDSLGNKIQRSNKNAAQDAIEKIKNAVIYLTMVDEHKKATEKGLEFDITKYHKNTKNLGRAKD